MYNISIGAPHLDNFMNIHTLIETIQPEPQGQIRPIEQRPHLNINYYNYIMIIMIIINFFLL